MRLQNHYPVETGATEASPRVSFGYQIMLIGNKNIKLDERNRQLRLDELLRPARCPAHSNWLAKKPSIKTLTVEGMSACTSRRCVPVPDAWRRGISASGRPDHRRASKCPTNSTNQPSENSTPSAGRHDPMRSRDRHCEDVIFPGRSSWQHWPRKRAPGHDCQVVCHAHFGPDQDWPTRGVQRTFGLGQLLAAALTHRLSSAPGFEQLADVILSDWSEIFKNRQSLLTMEVESTGVTVPATENTSHPAGSLARSSK